MDLPQLRAFVALADLKHFGRAADRLHITQPALTKRLQALETTIGASLFERDRTRTVLTPVGKALLADATRITADVDAFRVRGRNVSQGTEGRLDIGFGLSTIDIAPSMIGDFRRAYPAVTVSLDDFSSAEQMDRLQDGRLDIGFVRLPVSLPIMATRSLASDRLALACPIDFVEMQSSEGLDALNNIGFIMLNRERGPGLRAQIDRWSGRNDFLPRITQTANDIQTVLALVAAGLGVSIVPQQAVRLMGTAVKLSPLEGDEADWLIGAAWRSDYTNPAVRNFLRMMGK